MSNQQFTEKSRQALQFAQQLTVEYKNQEVSQEHLAYALLSEFDRRFDERKRSLGVLDFEDNKRFTT